MEEEVIEGNDNEVRLSTYGAHAIFVDKNSGHFIVRYRPNADLDEDAPEGDESDVKRAAFETMDDARQFCKRREVTKERVKRQPLNLRVLTEAGPVVVKAIHGSTHNPIYDAKNKKKWDGYGTGGTWNADKRLYPDHEYVATRIAVIVALNERIGEAKRQLEQERKTLEGLAIEKPAGYRVDWDDDSFRETYNAALALAQARDMT